MYKPDKMLNNCQINNYSNKGISNIKKPCPNNIPPKIRKYWESSLQYSRTPIQAGLLLYYEDLDKRSG